MTQSSINYAKVLYHLSVAKESVEKTYHYMTTVPELRKVLISPVAKREEKHRVIEQIFPQDMCNFLKEVCDNQDAGLLEEICKAYHEYGNEQEGILSAVLTYVTMPEETQLSEIKKTLCARYHKADVELSLKEDKSLLGGFLIRTGDREIDWSLKGRTKKLEQILLRQN